MHHSLVMFFDHRDLATMAYTIRQHLFLFISTQLARIAMKRNLLLILIFPEHYSLCRYELFEMSHGLKGKTKAGATHHKTISIVSSGDKSNNNLQLLLSSCLHTSSLNESVQRICLSYNTTSPLNNPTLVQYENTKHYNGTKKWLKPLLIDVPLTSTSTTVTPRQFCSSPMEDSLPLLL